jgi:exopolysaccharide biosynthesis polyprenyl glycosylphosphotransferase
MLVLNGRAYRTIQVVLEFAMLAAAWRVAIELRLLLNDVLGAHFERESLIRLVPSPWAVLLMWLCVCIWLRGGFPQAEDNLRRITGLAIVLNALLISLIYFSREVGLDGSRSFTLVFAPVSWIMLLAAQPLTRTAATRVFGQWRWTTRVAVLGWGPGTAQIVNRIRIAGSPEWNLAGVIVPDGHGGEEDGMAVPVLGTTAGLAEVINRERLDRIVVVTGCLDESELERCGSVSKRMGVTVSCAVSPAAADERGEYRTILGMHVMDLRPVAFTRGQEVAKRVFDVVLAITLIVLSAPLLLLLAIGIKVTSRGPVLFKQRRVGKGGRYFTFLKFRSMYDGAGKGSDLATRNESDGHFFKIRRDPRVTPLGRFMRKYSLDELPQFFNVLAGDMSLVGPRPLPIEDMDPDGMSSQFDVWAEQRARVLPGITGLWQIHGRADVPFPETMSLDIDYIRHWSLLLDLKILLKTPVAVLSGRGAY